MEVEQVMDLEGMGSVLLVGKFIILSCSQFIIKINFSDPLHRTRLWPDLLFSLIYISILSEIAFLGGWLCARLSTEEYRILPPAPAAGVATVSAAGTTLRGVRASLRRSLSGQVRLLAAGNP